MRHGHRPIEAVAAAQHGAGGGEIVSLVLRRRWLGRLTGGAIAVGVAYVLLLIHPQPLFAYELSDAGIVLHATRPIPAAMRSTLQRARARLDRTPLYDSTAATHVFICEPQWMFVLFAGTNYRVGGVTAQDVDLAQALRGFKTGAAELDPARSGLYTRYQLLVAYLVEKRGVDPKTLLRHPPQGTATEHDLAGLSAW